MIVALLAATAHAQVSNILSAGYDLEDCRPRIFPGTVAYGVGRQSIATNAQAYAAEALVARTLSQGSVFALQLNNVYGVTRVPALAVCGNGHQFGSAALDLFASATGVAIPIPLGDATELRVFYAGSVTGSAIHYPDGRIFNSRYYTSWAYAGFAYAAAFAAPAAPLLSRDDGLQTMAGDFIAGASLGLPRHPELGTLDVGYVYSSGLYSNVSSRKLGLFATTLLTDRFTLLALVRGGVSQLPVARGKEREVGRTSLYGRNLLLQGPAGVAEAARGVDLSTVHLAQEGIGGVVSVSAALALRPDVFLHEGSVGVAVPNGLLGLEGDYWERTPAFRATAGVVELPALPWYGTDGGRQLFVEIDAIGFVHVRRNSPSTLTVFPYAQGAWELSILLDSRMLVDADPPEDE